jgi:hypothetical protein
MPTLISAPAIARLCLHSRQWASAAIRRGWFGPAIPHRGVLFVPLREVEAYFEIKFTTDQIDRARDGLPDRVLTISEGNDHAEIQAQIQP